MRLPIREAAYFTGVPERTVQRWAMQERLTVDDAGMVDPDEVCELSDLRDTIDGRRLPKAG